MCSEWPLPNCVQMQQRTQCSKQADQRSRRAPSSRRAFFFVCGMPCPGTLEAASYEGISGESKQKDEMKELEMTGTVPCCC